MLSFLHNVQSNCFVFQIFPCRWTDVLFCLHVNGSISTRIKRRGSIETSTSEHLTGSVIICYCYPPPNILHVLSSSVNAIHLRMSGRYCHHLLTLSTSEHLTGIVIICYCYPRQNVWQVLWQITTVYFRMSCRYTVIHLRMPQKYWVIYYCHLQQNVL